MFNKNTKGYSVGGLVLLVVLLSAVAATFGKFNGASKHGSSSGLRESSASLEAAVLLQQSAQLQAATGYLLQNYTGSGSIDAAKIGLLNGVLMLDIEGDLFSESFRVPRPSGQSELISREWLITSAWSATKQSIAMPFTYALLPINSPMLCREINRATGSDELIIDPRYTPQNPISYPTLAPQTSPAGTTFFEYTSTYSPEAIPHAVNFRSAFCVCWTAPARCIFYAELARS